MIISESVTSVNSVLGIPFISGLVSTCRMKTCEEIQLENLLVLISEAGGESELAAKYGCSDAYIKQMARGYKDSKSGSPKGLGPMAARKLERCMEKPRGWMDHEHSDRQYEAWLRLPPGVRALALKAGNPGTEQSRRRSPRRNLKTPTSNRD